MLAKGRYYKSFRDVWQETELARKAHGISAVCEALQPFLNRNTWPQSGERLPQSLIEAVKCREILDADIWTRLRSRLLIVLALQSIFAIFVSSDIMPTIRGSLGGYWMPVGVVAALILSMVVVVTWLRCGTHRSDSEAAPASNAHLANHVAALHLLYVSHCHAQAAQSEVEAQSGTLLAHPPASAGTGQLRERCVHTITVCGSRYLVMENGRVFVDR